LKNVIMKISPWLFWEIRTVTILKIQLNHIYSKTKIYITYISVATTDLGAYTNDRSATLIDLIFTNKTRNIAKSGVIHNGMSDHSLIYVVMSAKKSSIRNKFLYFMQEWPLKRYKCWISQAVFIIKKVFISNNIKVKLCILFKLIRLHLLWLYVALSNILIIFVQSGLYFLSISPAGIHLAGR
jgi:hypothetical protein